jgi:type III pantothenate kinase
MLLLVDAGNTRIKWALADQSAQAADAPGCWQACGGCTHKDIEQLATDWSRFQINRVLLSNVAGSAIRARLEQLLHRLPQPPATIEWFASQPQLAGVQNGYRHPAQLGCDRFASMIGARTLFPQQALIVATCGTATTVDAITADGRFVGGMILPGLGLMATALARNTAQLPQVTQQIAPSAPFADNTDDAIASGCIAAQTGAIERAMAAHTRQAGPIQCLLSGGAAGYLTAHLSVPHRIVDNLVLIGLHRVAQNTKPPGTAC